MKKYFVNFTSKQDVIDQFKAPSDALDNAEVLLAWYGYGSYCGSALVIYRKNGELYEVNGSHCSCYGIEGQWEPEKTSPEVLLKREIYDEYEGYDIVQKALHSLARRLQKE